MGDQIAHRGPDDEQLYCDGPLGVLFRRLSIIDLPGGRQPLLNEDGTLVLWVNGEIYNYRELRAELRDRHRFRSESDCEVILHLYEEHGLGFLDHLNGMYTVALWDRREQRLILARDRLGIKPLYYSVARDRLIFGSELKALLAWPDCPRELDWEFALAGMGRAYAGEASSCFTGIEYLPGGSVLVADARAGSVTVRKYWDLTQIVADEPGGALRSDEEIVAGYRELLVDAVRINLQADVEVGLFLSGGIDSVSICAAAARERPLHTFSVLSLSTLTNGDAGAAHRAASHYGLPNHQVLFQWHEHGFSPEAWKDLLWLCETPQCGPEQLYKAHLHRYARAHRPGLKVMLSGQGSDEFNGGYCRGDLGALPEEEQSWSRFMASLRVRERLSFERPALRRLQRLGAPVVRSEFLASLAGRTLARHPWRYNVENYRCVLQQYNLWHEDRTAAGNSIENRVPFLDHRLVEYTLRIPPARHQALFWDKRILRSAMAGLVPTDLRERRKVPFFIGEDRRYTNRMMFELLLADDRALIREALGESGDVHPVFDRRAVEQAIAELPRDPEFRAVDELLLLVNAALLDKMAHRLPAAPTAARPLEVYSAVAIDDWETQAPQIRLRFARRRADVHLDQVPAFADNVYLVRKDSVGETAPPSFLVVDDQIKYVLEAGDCGPWLDVLRRVDGRRTLREILEELEVGEAEVRKYIEEALDFQLLVLSDSVCV